MAVLAFLSRGDDPEVWNFFQSIEQGCTTGAQAAKRVTGYIGTPMYNHGFATLALAEYYGLTNDSTIGPALKKATNLIVSAKKLIPKEHGDIVRKVKMRTLP